MAAAAEQICREEFAADGLGWAGLGWAEVFCAPPLLSPLLNDLMRKEEGRRGRWGRFDAVGLRPISSEV